MTNAIETVIETGRDLHESGVMGEQTLVDLIDLKVISLEETIYDLEELIRDLVFVSWHHQYCKDGGDIAEVIGKVPDKYIDFME